MTDKKILYFSFTSLHLNDNVITTLKYIDILFRHSTAASAMVPVVLLCCTYPVFLINLELNGKQIVHRKDVLCRLQIGCAHPLSQVFFIPPLFCTNEISFGYVFKRNPKAQF